MIYVSINGTVIDLKKVYRIGEVIEPNMNRITRTSRPKFLVQLLDNSEIEVLGKSVAEENIAGEKLEDTFQKCSNQLKQARLKLVEKHDLHKPRVEEL